MIMAVSTLDRLRQAFPRQKRLVPWSVAGFAMLAVACGGSGGQPILGGEVDSSVAVAPARPEPSATASPAGGAPETRSVTPVAAPFPIVTPTPYQAPAEGPPPEPDLLDSAIGLDERAKLKEFRDPNLGSDWRTDFSRRSIALTEFVSIIPRDGIPPIDEPEFFPVSEPPAYMRPREPVIAVEINGEARAYPLAIMMQHEVANDVVGGVPVVVTFCPLCNTAIAFDRRVAGRELTFGTSGTIRNSDLVMWDRQTETWWQQITGDAVIGELTGYRLSFIPVPIIAWEAFVEQFPDGEALKRPGRFPESYDINPYDGYDSVDTSPFYFQGETDGRLPANARVLTVERGGESVAYPFTFLQESLVLNDRVGDLDLAVFFDPETLSGFQNAGSSARIAGSTTVFERAVAGMTLTFESAEGGFTDKETGSLWSLGGVAISGPLEGQRLTPVLHANHFWFAWAVFKPETVIRDQISLGR